MPERTSFYGFDRVELLVHPMFALENIIVKGEAAAIKNVTLQDAIKDYEWLGIINNWKRKIDRISKSPRAIMVLVGPQALEREEPQRYFFGGKLTKKKLAEFSKEYQDLVRYAKQKLKGRVVFIRHSIQTQEHYLLNTLRSRGYIPWKEVRVYAYGEYMGDKEKKQCIESNAKALKNTLEFGQKYIWKQESKGTKVTHVSKVTTAKGEQYLSIGYQEGIPILQLAEVRRRLEKKGKISPYFLRFRMQTAKNYDFKGVAHTINSTWNKKSGVKK